ncbi:putative cation transporting ATPase, P-type [Desulfosarcina variabilis str. Montpellier]
MQILYLNVITDVFPALALAIGPGSQGIMKQPPRPRAESVLTRDHWKAVAGWAVLIAICVLTALSIAFYPMGAESHRAVTISFLTLAFGKLWFVFNLRHPQSRLLDNEIVRNPYIAGSIGLCAGLLVAAVYLPGLSDLLRTVPPGPGGWLLIMAMSLVPFVCGQIWRRMGAGRKDAAARPVHTETAKY